MLKIGKSTTLKKMDEQLIVDHKLSQQIFSYFLLVAASFIALAAIVTAIVSTMDDTSSSIFDLSTWGTVNLRAALINSLFGLIFAIIIFYLFIFTLFFLSNRLIGFIYVDQIQSILTMVSFLVLIINGIVEFSPLIHIILLFFVSINYFAYRYAIQRTAILTKIISTPNTTEIITRLDYPLAGILPSLSHVWYPNQNQEVQFTVQIREIPKSLTEPTPSSKIFRNISQHEYKLIHENKEISDTYNIMIVSGDVTTNIPPNLKLWGLSIAEFSDTSQVIRFENKINEFISFKFCEVITSTK